MSVKEDVLRILNENKETYLSGAQIAEKLQISRTAVWKAVKSLNEEGYNILGMNKRGYKMSMGDDIISNEGIDKFLRKDVADAVQIETFKNISSTNTVLKQRAAEGEREWLILVAEEQTAGRGRMNRKFYSPSGTGIYISFLLRPKFLASESLMITTMAAVAVAETIDEILVQGSSLNQTTQIKWMNDIFYKGKKVCGILTEAAINVENYKLDYAIPGIGINVKAPEGGFPDEIKDIAGALIDDCDDKSVNDELRNRMIARLIEKMYDYYQNLEQKSFMKTYKEKSMLIGKTVYILDDETKEPLYVEGVTDRAELIVRHEDGTMENLQSGEVSVRLF